MAIDWGLYNARVLATGDTAKERQVNSFTSNMTRKKVNSLSYKDITIDGVAKNLFITDTKDPYVKNFQDVDEIFTSAGTLIQYANKYWLVESMTFDGELYNTGTLRYCNYNLRFLSSALQPTSRYCCVKNSFYGTDINSNPVQIELGAGKFRITLPYDSETALFDRTYTDGRNQRLLMDYGSTTPRAYQIMDADRISSFGCVILTVEECERSALDSVTYMIADYDRYTAIPSEVIPAEGKCEIVYTGDAVLSVGLAAKKFSPIFLDPNGDVLSGVAPVWAISMTNPALESKVLTTLVGDDIYLQVTDVTMIGETVRLDLEDEDGTVADYVTIGVVASGRR